MAMPTLPITLAAASGAAFINIWLATRAGGARGKAKVSIGDGGNPQLIARMRAHANFVEYTPFVLILLGLIELNIGSPTWLWGVAGAYLFGRIGHGLGMSGLPKGRSIGITITMLVLSGLGIYAAILPLVHTSTAPAARTVEGVPARG